jgi:hypothetical protein
MKQSVSMGGCSLDFILLSCAISTTVGLLLMQGPMQVNATATAAAYTEHCPPRRASLREKGWTHRLHCHCGWAYTPLLYLSPHESCPSAGRERRGDRRSVLPPPLPPHPGRRRGQHRAAMRSSSRASDAANTAGHVVSA